VPRYWPRVTLKVDVACTDPKDMPGIDSRPVTPPVLKDRCGRRLLDALTDRQEERAVANRGAER
jgi:hypothetical protein